ncbi:MAG: VCBS repeat-containing protein [Nanoarchaeota archaeon]
MGLKKTLASIVIAGALALGNTGCEQRVEVKEPPQYNSSKDIDGDGKPDIVFAVRTDPSIFCSWYVFYKRNIGEGQFGDPIFLSKAENEPEGLFWEYASGNSDRGKYLRELIQKAEDSYKK